MNKGIVIEKVEEVILEDNKIMLKDIVTKKKRELK